MTLIHMLNCAAVPFVAPDTDKSIAARRSSCRQLRKHFQGRRMQRKEQEHLAMTTTAVVNEAVDTLHQVLSRSSSPIRSPLDDDLDPPPNSPNDKLTFDFPPPFLNPCEVLPDEEAEVTEVTPLSRAVRMRRSQRKRRRVPSFKARQTPRVPSKITPFESEEADDEASEDDEAKIMTRLDTFSSLPEVPKKDRKKGDWASYSSESEEELQLKLKVISEVERSYSSDEEKRTLRKKTDWAKIGQELRHIADNFSNLNLDVDTTDAGSNVIDLVSLTNMMLPFSIPQSLWSALVSYAAWKIFKRFQ